MEKKLYVHVGTHKTGSTSLQFLLFKNRKLLKERGLNYPTVGDEKPFPFQHAYLAYLLRDGKSDEFLSFMNSAFQDTDTVVISSEDFLSKEGSGFHEEMKCVYDITDNVKIIIYLRNQENWFNSRYIHLIRDCQSRYSRNIEDYVEEEQGQIDSYRKGDWYRLIEAWRNVFGRKNIIVIVFGKDKFIGGSIYSDFLSILNIELDGNFVIPKTNQEKNLRLSYEVTELIRKLNKIMNEVQRRQMDQVLRKYYARNLYVMEEDQYTYLTAELKEQLRRKYKDTNEKVAKEYLGKKDGILFHEEESKISDCRFTNCTDYLKRKR